MGILAKNLLVAASPAARARADRVVGCAAGSHRMAPLHRLLWIGGASVAVAAPASVAQGTDTAPPVAVEGACPTQPAVLTVLQSLLPSSGAAAAPASASVADRGAAYVVVVGDRTKTYPDADRNCDERARIAAAFIALALEPDSEPPKSERAPPPAPVAAPVPDDRVPETARAPLPTWLRLDGVGAFEVSSPLGLGSPGVALEAAAGRGAWGAWAACAWIDAATLRLAAAGESVRLERFPCAIGPAARLLVTRVVETELKAGVALGAMRAAGQGFAMAYSSERLEVGARVAIDAAFYLSPGAHLGPVAGLEVTYYPVPYHLALAPGGVVASTPTVWAGVTAGLRWNAL